MAGFSESWLREYQAKRFGAVAVRSPASIDFTLCRPTLLLNQTQRMHWRALGKYQASLSSEIARQVPDIPGRQPFQRAIVTILRYSVQEPDEDNLIGGTKSLVDCFLVRSTRHRLGLGFVVDDAPANLTRVIRHIRCATRQEQRTHVSIEQLPSAG